MIKINGFEPKEERGTGGTRVMVKVPYTDFLCENDVKDTALNITTLIQTLRPYDVFVPDSLKICVGQG